MAPFAVLAPVSYRTLNNSVCVRHQSQNPSAQPRLTFNNLNPPGYTAQDDAISFSPWKGNEIILFQNQAAPCRQTGDEEGPMPTM